MNERALLARLCDGPASGAELARTLGVSRSAVWKRIEALRAAGVEIAAEAGRGYALARPLGLLDADAIRAGLDARAAAELADLDLRFEIDSSNALALREAVPERGSRVFLCERQTAGRGRRGRVWQSPLAAHLYLTVSRRFDGGIARLQGLSLAVGVAIATALEDLGYAGIGVKWPNDLVVGGRKLGGILIELGGDAAGPVRVAIGVGLNVVMPPEAALEIEQPWCDLVGLSGDQHSTVVPSRNAIGAAVLNRLLPALSEFERRGLSALRSEWQRLDALVGKTVRVAERDGLYEGIARGIGDDGALRVQGASEERCFHGGEVSVRTA